MHYRFTSLLLRPSLLSSLTTTTLTGLLLIAANWSDLLDKFKFKDYVFGSNGLVGQLRESSSGYQTLFGENISYNLLVIIVAIFVGVSVYIILQLGGRLANDASAAWEALQAQDSRSNRTAAQHAAIRTGVAVIWLLYLTMFTKVILPWCVFVSRAGVKAVESIKGAAFILASVCILWLAFHVHTIFLRLVFMRPRVFGGDDAILAEELRGQTFKDS